MQTAAVMLVRAFEDKECAHVSVVRAVQRLVGRSVRNLYKLLGSKIFQTLFSSSGSAWNFVSDVLPASALRLCGACAVLEGTVLLSLQALIVWACSSQAFAGVGVRLVAVPGGAAHAGLLEMEMEAWRLWHGMWLEQPGCQCGLPTDWL